MSSKAKSIYISSDSSADDSNPWIPSRRAPPPMKSPFLCTSSDEDEKTKPAPSHPKKSPFLPSDEEEEEVLDVKPLAIIYPSDEDRKSSKSAKPRKPKMKGKGKGKKKLDRGFLGVDQW